MREVKINWFQKEIDSSDRTWGFIEKQGNLLKYLHNRHQWYYYPRMGKVAEFPLHVDIEVSSVCDLACPMCPRRHADTSEYGHMDFELFKKIVDECSEYHLFSARLSWRGESLTHPEFGEFVRYIKVKKKIPNVSFLTNGLKLDDKLSKQLVDCGLDYISFSVDGVGEVYDNIRAPLKFDDVYKKISTLKAIRDKANKKRPQIRVTGLWPAISQNPKEYFDKMTQIADKIVSNPVKDYRITEETKFHEDYLCQYPWERLFIGSDGRVQPCSNSIERLYIGDVNKQKIVDVWKGEEIEKLRSAHLQGSSGDYFACSRCSYRTDVDYESQLQKDWEDWDAGFLADKDAPEKI
ncbi:radical SAM/SPASM domain-containing protein [Planctomycetota bacterium]